MSKKRLVSFAFKLVFRLEARNARLEAQTQHEPKLGQAQARDAGSSRLEQAQGSDKLGSLQP